MPGETVIHDRLGLDPMVNIGVKTGGSTGIMQVFEVATHIWNRWGEIRGDENRWKIFHLEKPADWTDLQVKGARRGLTISYAGVGSHVTATILMDPDHPLKEDA